MKLMGRKTVARLVSLLVASLLFVVSAGSALAAEYDIAQGSVTVAASDAGQSVTQGSSTVSDSAPVVTGSSDTNTVTVTSTGSATASVTIKDVDISAPKSEAAITVDGNAEITVTGDNKLEGGDNAAGIEVGAGDSVTIKGDGKLDVTAGSGKNVGTGAAIGGANGEAGGDITITDNVTVTATGNGTVVDADKGSAADCSAAIGGGSNGAGGNVTISGNADVTAIGGGANGGTVAISGNANVSAQGGYNAAGIGGASDASVASSGAKVTISTTGTVSAKGGMFAAGIGGGARAAGGDVTIENATVNAVGGLGGAGVGGGAGGYHGGKGADGKRTIAGGAGGTFRLLSGFVTAIGGKGAAGIGGGSGAYCGNLNGTASQNGVGGDGATVIVVGGRLVVLGGESAVGIGAGSDAKWSGKNFSDKGETVFSASTAASNGTLSVAGGNGEVRSQSEGYRAVSAMIDWTADEANYNVVDENETGLYGWSPKTAPVSPADPTDPTDPAAPVDPAEPANPAAPEGGEDETIVPDSIPGDGGAGIDATGMTTIAPEQTPLASPAQWALVNLLCAIASGLASAWMLAGLIGKRGEDAGTVKTHKALRIGSLAVFAASAVAFFLTEDMRNAMQLTDSYTLLMVVLLLGQGALAILSAKRTVATADVEEK